MGERENTNGLQQPEGSQGIGVGGVFGLLKRYLDMTLGGQVVDLVGLNLLHHVNQAGGIRHVAVVKHQAPLFLVGVLIQVVDAVGIQQGSAALDAMHFVPLFEQELGEIGAILTGDAGDQSSFQEGVLLFNSTVED